MKDLCKSVLKRIYSLVGLLVLVLLCISNVYAAELVLTSAGQTPINPVLSGAPVSFSIDMQNVGSPTIAAYLRIRVDGNLIKASSSEVSSTGCSVFTINDQWFYCGPVAADQRIIDSVIWENPTPGIHTVRIEGSCYLYLVDNNEDGFWDPCPTVNSNAIEFTVQVVSTVQFSQPSITIIENETFAILTVERAGDLANEATVEYYTVDGSAIAVEDYIAQTQTLTWAVGAGASQQIQIPVVDNNIVEGPENFSVGLRNPSSNMVIGNNAVATVTISDDDLPVINLVTRQGIAKEFDQINGICSVQIESDPDRLSALPVQFTITGNATAGEDYLPVGTSLNIPIGQNSADIILIPVDDSKIEDQENVVFQLLASETYLIGENQCEIIIESDDKPSEAPVLPVVTITVLDAVATETDTKAANFQISLDAPADVNGLDVQISIAGSATGSSDGSGDYIAISEIVNIAAGSASTSVNIIPIDDNLKESEETIDITILASDSYTIGTPNTAQLKIIDNEPNTTDESEIIVQPVNNSISQQARLDEDISIVIEVKDKSGTLLQGAQITWTLESSVAGVLPLDSADLLSDVNGQATAIFHTANKPQIYSLKTQVKIENNLGQLLEVTQVFSIEAGIASTVSPDTPERAIATTMDTACSTLGNSTSQLSASQQALLDRCNDMATASIAGNDSEVQQALKAIAPEEVVSQGVISHDIALQQLGNIGNRLTALRRGIIGISFSG
ncbi:MAG: hypothetical protein OEX07_11645, partial [Gammaproteobacteria bacterium]|nr:hypothetical protein [Gammaproteobacteria bacterium]